MKPIAKVLVPVCGADRDAVTLATAIEAARPFNAHIEALFVHPDPREAVPQVGVPFSSEVIGEIIDGQEQYARAAEKSAHEHLTKVCGKRDVRILAAPSLTGAVTCSFREEIGFLPAVVAQHARLSDLVVFPPLRLPGFVDLIQAFLTVLTDVQRPVLVSTKSAPERLARSVALAWDGSKSASRAVMSALPFLREAERVHVFEIQEPRWPVCDVDVEQYLALHGVACTRKQLRLGAPSVGDMIAYEAAHMGADLLVMGGYGHSHLRETFFGGATSDVLERAALPIFLAH